MALSIFAALCGEPLNEKRRPYFNLIVAMFPFVLAGSAMIWYFFNNETTAAALALKGYSKKSVEYRTAFFFFAWLSSLVCVRSKLQGSVAWNAALVAAIFVVCFPIQSLDDIRQLAKLSILDDKSEKDIKVLEAGGVIAYFGALVSFLAAALAHSDPSPRLWSRIVIGLSVVSALIGCTLMWKSKSAAFGGAFRDFIFQLTDSVIVVVFIATVASISGVYMLSLTAGILSMAIALPNFSTFLTVVDAIREKSENDPELAEAGAAFCFLATLLTCVCCIIVATSKNSLTSSGYEVISG